MAETCPECGSQLRARRPNFLRNIRRRNIESRYDRYVCPSCETTFSREDIVEETDESISVSKWMEE